MYLKYPYLSNLLISTMSDLSFPGMTLCSSIAIKKSMLLALSNDTTLLNAEKSKLLQLKMDEYYHKYLEKYPMEDLINETLNFDDVVNREKTICLVDQINKSNFCKNLQSTSIATSLNLESCWTLFHASQTNSLLQNRDLIPNLNLSHYRVVINSQTVNGPRSKAPFLEGEIIRFLISLNKNESTSFHLPATGSIRFHDNLRLPDYIDGLIEIRSGEYLQIAVTNTKFTLLPAPFATKCINYKKSDGKESNPFFDNTYSHFDCIRGCILRKTISKCNCWPPEIPFIADARGNMTKNLRICNWMKRAERKSNNTLDPSNSEYLFVQRKLQRLALQIYTSCMANFFTPCEKKCRYTCNFSFVYSTYVRLAWPSEDTLNSSQESRRKKNCCSLLSIKFENDFSERQVLYYGKYDLPSTVSNIIGIFSLWVALTLAEMISVFKKTADFFLQKVK